MTDFPEEAKDDLEAYPLRLNVAALPERRFIKMMRTLTVLVTIAGALLIVLAVFLNYQITHLDVSVGRKGAWRFYAIDPEQKLLKGLESGVRRVNPLQILVEEKLVEYLRLRNSTVWDEDTMNRNFGNMGLINILSLPPVRADFEREKTLIMAQTRGSGLVRDVHIYDIQLINTNLWAAILETFDMPITDDLVSVCNCTDNSKKCLDCKRANTKRQERKKIWVRTSFLFTPNPLNPLGISIDEYISTKLPIHPERTYWDLPVDLRPDI